jgi:hypothetical protein
VVSSPFLAGDLVIGTCGEGGRGVRLAAIQPPETASSEAKEVYGLKSNIVPYVPTSVVRDEYFFGLHGSPVCVDSKLYCITVDGDVVVLRAGPKYELLGVNPLGEKSHATPAVANGRMFLRTFSRLFCVGGTKE